MRTTHIAIALLLFGFATPAPLPAGERPKPIPRRDAEIRKGVGWLDRHLFSLPDSRGTPRKPFTFAVAGLVHLMQNAPGETRSGKDPIPRIREYLASYVDDVTRRVKVPSELPSRHGLATSQALVQYTWPIAQAGVFFSELYLRGRGKAEARRTLAKIVAILEYSQEQNGGWGHGRINPGKRGTAADPIRDLMPKGMGGYPETLVASSNVVAASLGIIEASLKGEVSVLEKARAYYAKARLENGSFPYDPSQRSAGRSKTNVGRTAGAVFAMRWIGVPADDAGMVGSADYVMRNLEFVPEGHGSPCLNLMHGALMTHALSAERFARFRKAFEARISETQDEEGAFACICEGKAFGVTCDTRRLGLGTVFETGQKAYVTAIHTFVLLLERGSLRVLSRKPASTPTPRRAVPTKRPR